MRCPAKRPVKWFFLFLYTRKDCFQWIAETTVEHDNINSCRSDRSKPTTLISCHDRI